MRRSQVEVLQLRRELQARRRDELDRIRRGLRPKPPAARVPEPCAIKIAVVGTRTFSDDALFRREMNRFTMEVFDPIILVGESHYGAGMLGVKFAGWNFWRCRIYHAEILKYGVPACYHVRNREMMKVADWCIAFWDGESTGTEGTLKLAKRYEVHPVRVVRYE